MQKTYLLDTNILMNSPHSVFAFDEHRVLVTDVSLEELDRLKGIPGEKGASAREAIRVLESLREKGNILEGVPLPGGGKFAIFASEDPENKREIEKFHFGNPIKADDIILRCCVACQKKYPNLILITNDITMRVKAEILKVRAEEYKTDQSARLSDQYSGRCVATVRSEAINDFYKNGELNPDQVLAVEGHKPDYRFTVNEFALLVDECDPKHSALARFNGRKFVPLVFDREMPYGIKPKNIGQKFAQEALMHGVLDAPLVILKGPAGTAKTFYSLAVALEKVLGKEPAFEQILVGRPNIKFDDDIGFLPGDEQEKIDPLIRPVFDNLAQLTKTDGHKDGSKVKSYAQDLFDRGVITAQALAYIRGRSITDTYILIDESQNMTPTQAFGLISRCGIGSKIILAGDPEQIDNPHLDSRTNGLSYASEKMKGSPLCWQITFTEEECVRSALALEAIQRMSPKGLQQSY